MPNNKQNKKQNNKKIKQKQNKNKPKPKNNYFTRVQKAPVSQQIGFSRRNARYSSIRGGMSIAHTEFLGTVAGGEGKINVVQYGVNPGVEGTFPWLASIASKFEKYRFRKLEFLYHTSAATSATGVVYLSPDYDARDVAPATEAEFANNGSTVSRTPWSNFSLHVDCKKIHSSNPYLFVRATTFPNEVLAYDGVALNVGTVTFTATPGRLYVRYIVDLLEPQTSLATVQGIPNTIYQPTGTTGTWTGATSEVIEFAQTVNNLKGYIKKVDGVFEAVRKINARLNFSEAFYTTGTQVDGGATYTLEKDSNDGNGFQTVASSAWNWLANATDNSGFTAVINEIMELEKGDKFQICRYLTGTGSGAWSQHSYDARLM